MDVKGNEFIDCEAEALNDQMPKRIAKPVESIGLAKDRLIELGKVLTQMEQVLSSVIKPKSPALNEGEPDEKAPIQSPLMDELDNLNYRITGLTDRAKELYDRIDL